MSRRRRWLIGVIVVVVALPLALVALLAVQLTPGRLKPRIERQVRAVTGLVLHLDGDLEWHVWPLLRVSTGGARVLLPGEEAGAGESAGVSTGAAAPFARWHAFEATAQWRPLLHGELQLESLKLNGLELALHRAADGTIVWPKLTPAGGAAKPGGNIGTASLGRFELVDAAVRVDGVGDAAGVRLEALQLQSGVEFDSATGTLRLRDVALRGTAYAAPLPPAGVPVAFMAPALILRQEPLQLEAAVLEARVAGLAIDARIDGIADLSTPAAAGRLHAGAPSVREFARALGVELPPTRDAGVFGAMDLETAWRVDAGAVSLDSLRVQADGNAFTGTARAPLGEGQPAQFALAGERLDLDRYLRPKDQPGEPFELPVAMLRALRIEGELQLKEARLAGTTLRGVRLKVIDHVGGKRP
jgi:AsmA protein